MVVAVAVVVGVVVVVVVDLWKNICTDQTLILNSKSHDFFLHLNANTTVLQ